jgi:hypothetical protein
MYKKLIYLISFVFVLSLVLPNAVEADLVGWWKFDEDSGNTAMDSSGNGFDILLPDTTTWEDGLFGGAVHFYGVGEGNVGNFRYRLQWSSNLFDILNP